MKSKRFTVVIVVVLFFHLLATHRALGALIPRTPLPKLATITKPSFLSTLTVKFGDDFKVRAHPDGTLTSLVGGDLSNVDAVQTQYGLTFEQSIQLPQATLDFVETQAAQRSGVGQPDLGGLMVVRGSDETIEAAAQALLALEEIEWAYFSAVPLEPPCEDIIPALTPDYFVLRGVDPVIRNYHDPDPGLDMTCAWVYGARGQGIQIADAEFGYIRDHEDLCNINEPLNQTFDSFLHHGSAVLGVMVALDNGYGWTGLVPDVEAWFFTEKPAGQQPSVENRHTAITNAIATLLADQTTGDILLLEMQTFEDVAMGLNPGAPAEVEPGVWTLTRCATDSNIIVVAAAGNGNQNLDGAAFTDYRNRGDSGAIIVGAGSADTSHDKMNSSTYGSRVNVQGWGSNVFTLGSGNYAILDGDLRQTYTHTFTGTSSASSFVASAAAAIQSLAVAKLARRLPPAEMRDLLKDEVIMIPQGLGGHIGPFPDMAAAILDMLHTDPLTQVVRCDCNTNGVPDLCDIDAGTLVDANGNGIPDGCETACIPGPDCNNTGLADECDICAGTSIDCNLNNIPDECDIAGGTSSDCQPNGVPDECEPDCNGNGVADSCDIASGTSPDCNANSVPDECDITSGTSADCNTSGVPDECDISSGSSEDCDSNGIPDECVAPAADGACCLPDSTCIMTTEDCCLAQGGLHAEQFNCSGGSGPPYVFCGP